MGFSRQEYLSGLPDPGIILGSPALQADSLHLSYQGSPRLTKKVVFEQTCGGGESEPGIHLGEAHSQPGNHQCRHLDAGAASVAVAEGGCWKTRR